MNQLEHLSGYSNDCIQQVEMMTDGIHKAIINGGTAE